MKSFNKTDWQAEDDANTLARYNEIVADSARVKRAQAAAKQQASDLLNRYNVMSAVSGATKGKKKSKKPTANGRKRNKLQ